MNYKPFYQKNSRSMRFWHWATFIIIVLSFYSVFVGKFFLNPFNTAATIHDSLQHLGFHNNPDPSFPIAQSLSKKIWDWHIRYGYALTALFLFRILIEGFQKSNQRFKERIKSGFFLFTKKEYRKAASHYLIVRFIYLLFYLTLMVVIGTGLWLSFHRQSSNMELAHSVKQIHEDCFYFLLLFITIHISGVIRAERKGYKNIVSNMINGGNENEQL